MYLQWCLQQLLANIVLKLPENYNVNRTYCSSLNSLLLTRCARSSAFSTVTLSRGFQGCPLDGAAGLSPLQPPGGGRLQQNGLLLPTKLKPVLLSKPGPICAVRSQSPSWTLRELDQEIDFTCQRQHFCDLFSWHELWAWSYGETLGRGSHPRWIDLVARLSVFTLKPDPPTL